MSQNGNANWVGVVALVCGIVSFFFNPLYILVGCAIGFGIGGLVNSRCHKKGMALTGLILGGVAAICQFVVDLILSVFTFGLSFLI